MKTLSLSGNRVNFTCMLFVLYRRGVLLSDELSNYFYLLVFDRLNVIRQMTNVSMVFVVFNNKPVIVVGQMQCKKQPTRLSSTLSSLSSAVGVLANKTTMKYPKQNSVPSHHHEDPSCNPYSYSIAVCPSSDRSLAL